MNGNATMEPLSGYQSCREIPAHNTRKAATVINNPEMIVPSTAGKNLPI